LVIVCSANLIQYFLTKFYYTWRNQQKAKKWDALTDDQKLEYLETTTDSGSKRLDFRFVS
jgi:hypothetical protein